MAARVEPDGAGGTGAREARCAICWEWRALAEVGFLEGCLHWMCRGCALAWAGAGQGRPGAGAEGRGGYGGAEGGAGAVVSAAAAPMRCPLCRATCIGLIFPGNPVQRLRVGGPQAGTIVEIGLRLSPRQLDRRRAYLAGHEAPGPGQLRALAAPGGRGPGRPTAVRAGAIAREVETFAREELEALTLSADVELLANSATVAVLGAVQGSAATDGGESWNEDARAALVTGLGGCLSPRQADLFARYLLAFAETGVTLRSFDSLLEEYSETAWGEGGALEEGLKLAAALRGAAGRQAQSIRRRASRAPPGSRAANALQGMALEFLEARHAVGSATARVFSAEESNEARDEERMGLRLLSELRSWLQGAGDELFQGAEESSLLGEESESRVELAAKESACLEIVRTFHVEAGYPVERLAALRMVLRNLHEIEDGPRLPLALWRAAPAAARQSGYSKDNFSYGSTPLASWWSVFRLQELEHAVRQASVGDMECVVWGSSVGWLVFYGALGLGMRSVGYEIVPCLGEFAEETRRMAGLDAPGMRGLVDFRLADMLNSDLSKASVLLLTSQCWDSGLVRAACSKIAAELPKGSAAVDYGEALTEWLGEPVACVSAPVSWNEEQKFFVYRKADDGVATAGEVDPPANY